MPNTFLATFKVDITVPLGHPLCGGWITPAKKIGTPLYCYGLILQGPEAPIVLVACDWTGILNQSHIAFTKAIAQAAHTTPERVALHCVHQHNAPFIDVVAQQYVSQHKDLPPSFDVAWFDGIQKKVCQAVVESLKKLEPVTHIHIGMERVEGVASNRRIVGKDGKLLGWRGSVCKDAKLKDAPVGLIDPGLRTIGFWNHEKKLAALHYFACHPMSYYGDGEVNYDFVGIAREKRIEEDNGVPHLYFTGCAGNIAAGKYNDGSPAKRLEFAEIIRAAMEKSDNGNDKEPLERWEWRSTPVHLPPRKEMTEEKLLQTMAKGKESVSTRIRAAMQLSYLKRCEAKLPIILNGLILNSNKRIIHLPGECFIEYQQYAKYQLEDAFLITAAYGDGGPWYIPPAAAYAEGGYEITASWVAPEAEVILQEGIKHFLRR
jgi:hypothetical protein